MLELGAQQSKWKKVVQHLELSRLQSKHILQLREDFLKKTADTISRREAAVQQLASALPQVRGTPWVAPGIWHLKQSDSPKSSLGNYTILGRLNLY